MQDEQDAQRRGSDSQLPYQPRVRRNRPQQGDDQFGRNDRERSYSQESQGQSQNPPGMLAVEDKLNQFAEGTYSHAGLKSED